MPPVALTAIVVDPPDVVIVPDASEAAIALGSLMVMATVSAFPCASLTINA